MSEPTPEQKDATHMVARLREWLSIGRRQRRRQGLRYSRVAIETELRRQEAIARGESPERA